MSLSVERTLWQDVGFGFRQLTDIAERTLSSGINDTTAAVRSVQEMHGLLRPLAGRRGHRLLVGDPDGTPWYRRGRQDLDGFLAVAVDNVRRAGRDQPRITLLLDDVLAGLHSVALPKHLPDITTGVATKVSAMTASSEPASSSGASNPASRTGTRRAHQPKSWNQRQKVL
ncbi:DUF2254 family protein [Micromonospora sp. HM134]|uniref:DUF2254 family protein n=1 Tax=Micromonospora sp. HM134 TaxID=2583243 RepID=UPI00197C42A6|nr:DUF2254 family protein [Micromonospora sp. HM134]